MDGRGWSTQETRCLISIWAEESVQRKLDDSYRNRAIYEYIAKKMEESGYSRAWQQCQRKIKHLKNAFRKAKDSNNKSGRDRVSCPFYEELDRVLGDRPSFCPGEGDVLDSELDYSEEPLFNSTVDGHADAALSSPTEAQGDDDQTDALRTAASSSSSSPPRSSSSSSSSSSKRPSTSSGGHTRRKKSRFETTLEAFSKALCSRDDEVLLQMQRAQHAHEERLFGMMMQSIASLASTMAPAHRPPVHAPSFPVHAPWYQPMPAPPSQSAPPVQHHNIPCNPPRPASHLDADDSSPSFTSL